MITAAFAYSTAMQIILFFVSCFTTFLFYYLVTNIILKIYAAPSSIRRKLLFVSVSGLLLNNIWTYSIYMIGGRASFPSIVYSLVTVPNPLFALLIYYSGVRILGLSPFRSLHIIDSAYIYFIAVKLFNRFIGFTFFQQSTPEYNYLLDALSLVFCTILNVIIYYLTMLLIDRHRFVIQQTDQLYTPSLAREIARSFLKACAVYSLVIILPILIKDQRIYLVITAILAMWIVVGFLLDSRKALLADLSNKETYISNLVETIDRFRGLKHDINNMLSTYEGYIMMGDLDELKKHHRSLVKITGQANYRMDLANRMQENPALVALINRKLEYAESLLVNMEVSLSCDLGMDIDNMDICRAAACLLDNAIEAAAESAQRSVLLSIEKKPDQTKLIIVKNSTLGEVDVSAITQGATTKAGHAGMGLAQMRRTLGKYGNCSFHISYYQHSFTAYVAIRKSAKTPPQ